MATSPATSTASPRGSLSRDRHDRVLAGVCAGLARYFGLDPLLVRVVFVASAAAGGLGLAAYALGWLVMPAADPGPPVPARPRRTGRASIEVALGVGLLLLSVLLTFRALGVWFSDAVVWPLVLVVSGGALIWRQSLGTPVRPAPTPTRAEQSAPTADAVRQRAGLVSRSSLGVALVVAAGLAFLQATGALSAARDVVLAALVVAIVLGVIFAPWILRLLRSLSAERAERIRSQERAEMAAHVHDSVLQTLALMQKRAHDPHQVAALARGQERELRSWLSGRTGSPARERRLASALEDAAEEIERSHGVAVDVVAVGDCDLHPGAQALVSAVREAMVNAAKFGERSPVAVYVEASDGRIHVFVRDRGPGFDPESIPPDRRGVRESIVGRMERHGGQAFVRSSPGAGTEVELVLEGPQP